MLSKLKTDDKIVGVKQVRRAITSQEQDVKLVFVAKDADEKLLKSIIESSKEQGIQVVEVDTMEELGEACEIDVSAAVAALL